MPIPDWDRTPDAVPRADSRAPPATRARGVLVVDDSAAIRELLGDSLRRHGYTVWQAEDGTAAVETFRQHGAAIHLILMDVRMPRLDGPHALAAIRRFSPGVPCCFMSGDLGGYSGAELADLSGRAILSKPFQIGDVFRMIEGLPAEAVEPAPAPEHQRSPT